MADGDDARIRLHEDIPLFREAIAFTTARTRFDGRFIEKDYFSSVLLDYFARHGGADLMFKGGTCLAKVHMGFYRLSEDLDFTIPIAVDASRSERSRAAAAMKQAVTDVSRRHPCFSCDSGLKGANDSAQYSGVVRYQSILSGMQETILIDLSVREPALTPSALLAAHTVLMDPVGGQAAVPRIAISCISVLEAMAEKFRAALSRRDVAIRDFYDLDYAAHNLSFDIGSEAFVEMVRRKLSIPGNPPVDVGQGRMSSLRRQVDAKLKTVLQEEEFRDFVLDRAIARVVEMAARLG